MVGSTARLQKDRPQGIGKQHRSTRSAKGSARVNSPQYKARAAFACPFGLCKYLTPSMQKKASGSRPLQGAIELKTPAMFGRTRGKAVREGRRLVNSLELPICSASPAKLQEML